MTITARVKLDATFTGEVGTGATEDHDIGDIPIGKWWRVLKLGASQFASGTNVSGRVQLQIKVGTGAWEVMREIALAATTFELNIDTDIKGPVDGDAANKVSVRVVRENGPGQPRSVTAWITGYEF